MIVEPSIASPTLCLSSHNHFQFFDPTPQSTRTVNIKQTVSTCFLVCDSTCYMAPYVFCCKITFPRLERSVSCQKRLHSCKLRFNKRKIVTKILASLGCYVVEPFQLQFPVGADLECLLQMMSISALGQALNEASPPPLYGKNGGG